MNMETRESMKEESVLESPDPTRDDQDSPLMNIWSMLQTKAMVRLADLVTTLHQVAPRPGDLLYVDAKPLPYRWADWNPVLFSSIDVCTHLQVARVYLTPTIASAVDFLLFMTGKYPFALKELRSPQESLFTNTTTLQCDHAFTREARSRGIFHSIVTETKEDNVLGVVSKYFYQEAGHSMIKDQSQESVMKELVAFLFFHNNHRSVPCLSGKTPVQKLKSFDDFTYLEFFDPYEVAYARQAMSQLRKL